MKRTFALILVLLSCSVVRAADAVTLAAQQEAQDNMKRLTATIEEYQVTMATQKKMLDALAAEVSKLRDEIARNNNDSANKEAIHQLREDIQKVDKARLTDNEKLNEALVKLGDTIKRMPATALPRRSTAIPTDPGTTGGGTVAGKTANPRGGTNTNGAEEGFEYVVVSGDRPDKIAAKYQAEGIKVTAKSIIAANPNVDWTKLKVGDKLFIPKPK